MLACRALTIVELLRRQKPDFITAPNLWLPDIGDLCPVDNNILTVIQERVYQQSARCK